MIRNIIWAWGACLLLPSGFLEQPTVHIDTSAVAGLLRLKRFEQTTSMALEVRAALWGLEEFRAGRPQAGQGRLRLYCDSQCIAGLLARRAALKARGYATGASGRQLNNAPLYRAFYALYDQLGFDIVKGGGPYPCRRPGHDTAHIQLCRQGSEKGAAKLGKGKAEFGRLDMREALNCQ